MEHPIVRPHLQSRPEQESLLDDMGMGQTRLNSDSTRLAAPNRKNNKIKDLRFLLSKSYKESYSVIAQNQSVQ